MTYRFCRLALFCALALAALSAPQAARADVGPAVQSVNDFALRAAGLLGGAGQDFFFSPYSILSALGMTYAGARGRTARAMEKALEVSPTFHAALGELTRELTERLDGGEGRPLLTSANRVWLRKDMGLQADFTRTLSQDYGSAAVELDFKDDAEGARRTINRWVEERTHDRIRDLLPQLNPDTRMILTNAVYFTARWEDPFNEERTAPAPFHITASQSREVPMMRANRKLAYGEAEGGIKLLRLPYRGRLSLLLALPPQGEMEAALKALREGGNDALARWTQGLSTHQVDLWLPKFRTEKKYELKDLLTALGMGVAFSDLADFSGITADTPEAGAEPLRIDAVIHQTFIEVDETKTEAAAATAVTMVRATALPHDALPRAEFHADRPFLYFVMDNPTGAILFMGRQCFN